MPTTEPAPEHIACNRCNAERRTPEHPCPACGCPEFRLLDTESSRRRAEAVARLAAIFPKD